jgi:hypothetical protein
VPSRILMVEHNLRWLGHSLFGLSNYHRLRDDLTVYISVIAIYVLVLHRSRPPSVWMMLSFTEIEPMSITNHEIWALWPPYRLSLGRIAWCQYNACRVPSRVKYMYRLHSQPSSFSPGLVNNQILRSANTRLHHTTSTREMDIRVSLDGRRSLTSTSQTILSELRYM